MLSRGLLTTLSSHSGFEMENCGGMPLFHKLLASILIYERVFVYVAVTVGRDELAIGHTVHLPGGLRCYLGRQSVYLFFYIYNGRPANKTS